MPEVAAKLFGRLLLAFANTASVNHDSMFVGDVVDANRAEGESLEAHGCTRGPLTGRILCLNPRWRV
jgi:hypothetical protein